MRVTLYRDHPAEGWPSMDRYADSLFAALQQILPVGWELRMPKPPDPWPGPYGQLLRRCLGYYSWVRRERGNLNHIVDHSYSHLLLALDPTKTVITVHDVAPLHFRGRQMGLSELSWKLAWQGLRRAKHLIADSAFTRAELCAHLDLPPEHIHVVYLAVSPAFHPQAVEKERVRQRYRATGQYLLLHVGHTQPRKNLPALLQALAQLQRQGMAVSLLQVGGWPDPSQQELLRALDLANSVHFLGRVSERELVTLYNATDVFVFPSTYEGFGLPALEAMACGTPVVSSNAASLPEVVGDAGLLVDPNSPEALAKAIASVLDDPVLAAELRQNGLQRAGQFTWEQTARDTLSIYRQVAGGD